jgi:uncharacterized protein GlcG (DUF336 family)
MMNNSKSRYTLIKLGLAATVMNMTLVSGSLASEEIFQSNISMKAAQKVARKAVNKCRQDGFNVSAAIVDASGVLVAHLRADGAGPHTVSSAFRKAFTAASLRRSTGELANLVVNVPTTAGLRDMNDNMLLLQGGLPITNASGDVIGGVGVGGAPGGQFDEACAQEAINSLDD